MQEGLWNRRLGARRSSPAAGFEHSATARAERARAELERLRGRGVALRPARPLVAFVLAASFATGLGGGAAVAEALLCWLTGAAPRVETIAVRGAVQLAAAEIAAASGVPRGVDLRRVDPAGVAARLAADPWIARARAVELPSGRLLVDVLERRAVATVSARRSARAFAVDANGTAFAPERDRVTRELPRLVQASRVVPGEPNPELARAVELAGRLPALGLPRLLELAIAAPDDPEGFSLRLEGVAPRVLLGRDDPEARLPALVRVLASGLPEVADAGTLDLRFADQVVLRGTPPGSRAADAARGHGSASAPDPVVSGGRDRSTQGG